MLKMTATSAASSTALTAGTCLNRLYLKILAAKIAVFGLVIFSAMTFSVHISAMAEEMYQSSMEETVKEAQELADEINESTDSDGNFR